MSIGFPVCNTRALVNLNAARKELVDRIKSIAEAGGESMRIPVSSKGLVFSIDVHRIMDELKEDGYTVTLFQLNETNLQHLLVSGFVSDDFAETDD